MRKLLLLFVVFGSLMFTTVGAEERNPTAVLQPVLPDIQAILEDESLQGNEHLVERRDKIMSLIKRRFDFREMSKRVLGKTWRQIDDKERDNFTVLMTKFLENVYLGKLEGYSGKAVEFVAETIKNDRAQVTTIVEHENEKIPLHYIMNKTASGWMVYDINIEGVSLIKNYQEQFKSILRKDDYQGLVKVLEEKNRSFRLEAQ
jgi:phospholipid transport system substrate-binding protein